MAESYSSPRGQSLTVLVLDEAETEALNIALTKHLEYRVTADPLVETILLALEG